MLYDAVKVFEKKLNREAAQFRAESENGQYTDTELEIRPLVDNYVPKDGTYVLLNLERDFACMENVEFRLEKKSGELFGKTHKAFSYIRYLDYNSKLVEMNKPIDSKKVIHSNQIFSFFVKKDSITEGKLTEEVINGYYNTLANPESKYRKSKKAVELYQMVECEAGAPDGDVLERIRCWVINWRKHPEILPVDYTGKDYLKLFFVLEDEKRTKELFETENRRYVIPNIYNNNDYNLKIEETIVGLPGNNMGLNAKKPFLENKTRKTAAPYLISMEDVILQGRFFDYLWGCACKGAVNVYIDFEKEDIYPLPDKSDKLPFVESGMYLRVRKGKDVEILDCDTVVELTPNLKSTFYMKDILKARDGLSEYRECRKVPELAAVIDEVFFGKQLAYNYFTPPLELDIKDKTLQNVLLTYRNRLFAWLYRTPECDMEHVLAEMAEKLIKNSIGNGYWNRARQQLNLALSLEDYLRENNQKEEILQMIQKEFKMHLDMHQEEWDFTDDGEYFFAVGQLIGYFLSLSRAHNKPYSMANQFLNAKEDALIKEKLSQMFIRYNHAIDAVKDTRAKNMISHILLYHPRGGVRQQELIAGLTAVNAFYMKKEEDANNDE